MTEPLPSRRTPADTLAHTTTSSNASTERDAIAVVGIGCRFPGGASSPKAFWNLLCRGKDALVDVPPERWDLRRFYDPNPAKPGKMHVKQGGFLKEKLDHFDPLFFGISPREAESMDPQQRLLLEVTWEAFEDAGLVAESLAGSRTGVFIGGFCLDNLLTRMSPLNRDLADSHTAANSTMTILSNRISFVFDLRGPSVTMDTACSSSLVATHYACQSLWHGDSEMALAGGVNTMFRPEFPIAMSKGKFLSQHGRCKTFDIEAAGYARGEGAGIVLLKTLSRAQRDGDRIYALIRGTGVNQDGHTPGLSMPNADSQESLIRRVYQQAGVPASAVGYIEAHGTGTQVGDFAETSALHRALSEGRAPARKCYVGSVKTNIGHTEAAAGVAGLIKAILALSHQRIPPNLHFKQPNPKIPFDELCLQVPTQAEAWERNGEPRYAGVNSFGYGGTNAHVLLQEAPLPATDTETPDSDAVAEQAWEQPYLLPISARSQGALRELAGKYAFHLSSCRDSQSLADFLYTITRRRSHHDLRASFVASDPQELRAALQRFSSGQAPARCSQDSADSQHPERLVFIYTGMGPQWWGMGRELMASQPVFRAALERFDESFATLSGWSLLKEFQIEESQSRMARTEVAQPANFALQFALTELWKSWGIEPDSVVGHSVGEVASAYASGALALEDAVTVSYHRSRLQQTLAGQGAMLATGLSETEALQRIADLAGVSIAAINSPNGVTLSGDPEPLRQLDAQLQAEAVFARPLAVEVAYHSPQMEAIREEVLEALSGLRPQLPRIPLYSTVSGGLVAGASLDANYWWNNVRQPVRFLQAIQALLAAKRYRFLEVGPHPVLGHSVKEIAAAAGVKAKLTTSLHRKEPENLRVLETLGQLYTQGHDVEWSAVTPARGQLVEAPTYPWQRERYWKEAQASAEDRLGNGGPVFLSSRLEGPQAAWTVEVNEQYFPFLHDHQVNGHQVFPGAGYVEAALQLCHSRSGRDTALLKDLSFESMLEVEQDRVQLLCSSYDERSQRFAIHSRLREDGAPWQLHAAGRVVDGPLQAPAERVDMAELTSRFAEERSIEEMYEHLRRRGLDYGPSFQCARSLRTQGRELLARIDNDYNLLNDPNAYRLPIGMLDTAFHTILSIVEDPRPYVPVSIAQLAYYQTLPSPVWFHGVIYREDDRSLHANLRLIGDDGAVYLEINDAYMRAVPKFVSQRQRSHRDFIYRPEWVEQPAAASTPAPAALDGGYLLFGGEDSLTRQLARFIEDRGRACVAIREGDSCRRVDSETLEIDPAKAEDFVWALREAGIEQPAQALFLWPAVGLGPNPDYERMTRHCLALAFLARAAEALELKGFGLTVVTRGAQAIDGGEPFGGLSGSPLWALGSVIENELSSLFCQTVDLDPACGEELPPKSLKALLEQRLGDVALRGEKRFARLLRRGLPPRQEQRHRAPTSEAVELAAGASAGLEGLSYRRTARSEPGPGELEIHVSFAKTSPRDVLKAQGRVSPATAEAWLSGSALGLELTGTVKAAGPGVEGFAAGDRVVASVRSGFRSYATAPVSRTVRIPEELGADSFFLVTDFLPAYYAFARVARLQPGERVLIHDGASSLGLAAIQTARWLGAEIYATADSAAKLQHLSTLGLAGVLDASSLAYADELVRMTGGRGVDVALHTLSETQLPLTLATLASFGRLVDLGEHGAGVFRGDLPSSSTPNVLFARVDSDHLLAERPELAAQLLEELRRGFEKGKLQPLPKTVFAASEASEALRHATAEETIGSTVLRFEDESVELAQEGTPSAPRLEGGSYLITGGNSGFGLAVARWLAAKGAARLTLLSRSGAASPEAQATLADFAALGIAARSVAVDVTDREQLAALVDELYRDEVPLRGIVHAAMTLDDAFLSDLDRERLHRVMAPKIIGATNLYELTQDRPLDFFLCFSSISSLIGNRGQANYVAANAFLDAFAHFARRRGAPVITINWGALAETGVLARNARVARALEQEGVQGLGTADALAALEALLADPAPQIGVFDVDWPRWTKASPRAAASYAFSELAAPEQDDENDRARSLLKELNDLKPEDRRARIESLAMAGFCKVLKIPLEKMNTSQSLTTLGIDSLLLLELALTIQSEFGVRITAAELSRHPTIGDLAEGILNQLSKLQPHAA